MMLVFSLIPVSSVGQHLISGRVIDKETSEPIAFASLFSTAQTFGSSTDENGYFSFEVIAIPDSIKIRAANYNSKIISLPEPTINLTIQLSPYTQVSDEVDIVAPKDRPSIALLKNVVKHKPQNDMNQLEAYEYKSYTKSTFNLTNITDKFKERKIVKNLKYLTEYIDTTENGEQYLPFLLAEAISHIYHTKKPRLRREIIEGSKITGVDRFEMNDLMGDTYIEFDIYDNYMAFVDKSIVSPISNVALLFYDYHLLDTIKENGHHYYQLEFTPKRSGDLVFTGDLWIDSASFAVKEWTGDLGDRVNINYVQALTLNQKYKPSETGKWLLTEDSLSILFNATKNSKLFGIKGNKKTIRTDYILNKPHSSSFYEAGVEISVSDSAAHRNEQFWNAERSEELSTQEQGISSMIDSINQRPLFRISKDLLYMAATGFYPFGPLEIGDVKSLFSRNKVEGVSNHLYIRTSLAFSKRIELSANLGYGYKNQEFKYGGKVRYNVTSKKRNLLTLYYQKNVEQLSFGEGAGGAEQALAALLAYRQMENLLIVEKFGGELEKDFSKEFTFNVGVEWRKMNPLGDLKFERNINQTIESINKLTTFETIFSLRYAKNQQFLSGSFDRIVIDSKYPIITLSGVVGIKNVLHSEYNYQKLELNIKQRARLGLMGTLNYEVYGGMYFGKAPYPFLKVHEGVESYWLLSSAHNRMNYHEFISDQYVGAKVEHHFNGLVFDRIPLMNRLKWRLVVGSKSVWGRLSPKQAALMVLPEDTKSFGKIPYTEVSAGIENIFNVIRIDAVWRATHRESGVAPVAIRGRISVSF